MRDLMPADWRAFMDKEFEQDYFKDLSVFVESERQNYDVFPPEEDVFNAFKLCKLNELKLVILGQDPYHNFNQAHGLCFSVKRGIKLPPSLKNIYKEMEEDLSIRQAESGDLTKWAEQGVLLLNTVLTVRAHEANSHKKKGWETFTDAVIKAVDSQREGVVFVLWGRDAKSKIPLINTSKHLILSSSHPSPYSANYGFMGCGHFKKINEYLTSKGQAPINWQLPD